MFPIHFGLGSAIDRQRRKTLQSMLGMIGVAEYTLLRNGRLPSTLLQTAILTESII